VLWVHITEYLEIEIKKLASGEMTKLNNGDNAFYKALKKGPAFLLLGQDYLRLESGIDPFLSEVLRKYDKTPASHLQYPQYSQILEGGAKNSIESTLAWMQERCYRLSTPLWLKTVADYAWSGVYSSAIDVIWPSAFHSEWRELQHLFQEKQRPIDPRNRSNLHCTYLFGNVSRTEETERPPLTNLDFLKRKHVAVALARRLPEIITPFGVLVIEGYAGARDWLRPEDLVPIIDELNPGQTHIFSVTEEIAKNPYIADFAENGKLILHSESLATILLRGDEAGFLQLGKRPVDEEDGQRIQLGENILTVPSDIWNRVSMSAMILDDSMLITPPSLSEDKLYDEFRNFLFESSTRPTWSGYERGFNFHREFEIQLYTEVDKSLKSKELQNEPIIIHGQTGTGKTVALGALAYKIRKERKHPVLFIERKNQKPTNSDIDYFCKWAEDCGAPTTLIVWDGMVELGNYYELLRYLASLGRKVVLVGSCYHLDTDDQRENFIEAPTALSQSEVSNFTEFINNFGSELGQLLEESIKRHDDTFLVALYRLLPPTRSLIRSGVQREYQIAEREIGRIFQEKKLDAPSNTLGCYFVKSGLISEETFLSSELKEIGGEKVNEIEELIGLVIVPGRFGLKVPLELLLRACGNKGVLNFANILEKIDIIRLSEDATGNIEIGPRHPLEAKLLAQVRLGGSRAEVDFVKQLILEIRESYAYSRDPEVQFAVELIRNMGPNGQDAAYFAPHYVELSRTLRKLREERGVQNPRLMLQEAALLRESVIKESRRGTPPIDAVNMLTEAEKTLGESLKLLKSTHRNDMMKSVILVELASTLGAKAQHISTHTNRPQDSIPLFKDACDNLFKARDLNPHDYYTIDVLAWMTKDILKSDILDPQTRADIEADILCTFEMAEPDDFGSNQQVLFHKRRMEIGALLDKRELSDDAFDALLAKGSYAGYYLRAYDKIKDVPIGTELNRSQRNACQLAVKYLEENRQAIVNDSRCLYLLLHTWWKMRTGKPLFYGERQTLPFSQDDWQYCLRLISDLANTDEPLTNPSLIYLRGVTTFHIGDINGSLRIFRELGRGEKYVTGRRRIIRSYLASTSDGKPEVFNGTVDWVSDNGAKGEVYVEKLRSRILFLPHDFSRPDIQKHDTLNKFHLAFNFIGPIADPIRYLKSQQR
jgi:hypothetical protein